MPPETDPSLGERGAGEPVMLARWECGHVEVDDGSTHECDGRDVCSAKYFRVYTEDEVRALCERNAELVQRCTAEDGSDLPPARVLAAALQEIADGGWAAGGPKRIALEALSGESDG
jgi:hypothetical protein